MLGKTLNSIYHRNSGFWKLYQRPSNLIDLSPSSHLAYMLGVLLGDGYSHHDNKFNWHFGLRVDDKEFAEAFADAFFKIGLRRWPKVHEHLISTEFKPEKHNVYACKVGCNKMGEWYSQLSYKKIEDLLGDDENIIFSFLRGYFDSEGSIHQDGQTGVVNVSFANTNDELSFFVSHLLKKVGFDSAVVKGAGVCLRGTGKEKLDFIAKLKPTIKRKLEKLNLNKVPITRIQRPIFWDSKEVDIIQKNYYSLPKEKLLELLPNRTWESIKQIAVKLKPYIEKPICELCRKNIISRRPANSNLIGLCKDCRRLQSSENRKR